MSPWLSVIFLIQVVVQTYNTYVHTTDVIQGNDVILKCEIPSFVTDFVQVIAWEDELQNVIIQSQGNAVRFSSNPIRRKCFLMSKDSWN